MEDFREQVDRLRAEKGLTKSKLVREASGYESAGTSLDTIRNAVSGRRGKTSTAPAIPAMAAIARALDVPADTFPAYRLAVARTLLDPEVVGGEQAISNADALLARVAASRSPEEIVGEAEGDLRTSGKKPSSRSSATRRPRSGPAT